MRVFLILPVPALLSLATAAPDTDPERFAEEIKVLRF
jgi:hypothetical protein